MSKPMVKPGINPNPGILLYTKIRKTPFYYASRQHGVQLYSVHCHHYHPRLYGDPIQEYWALLNDVTLWDVGVELQVEISGPDAFDFTNMLIARDLHKCKVGQCKYVFLTAADGGIINDPVLLRLEENRFWLSLDDSDVWLWAQGLAHFSDMDVDIRVIDVAPVQIQGPKAKKVMLDLFGEEILQIPYYYMREFELDDMRVVVSRTGYTGEIGYEIYLYDATANAVKLWDRILEAGQPHDLRVIGPSHIRRIEAGMLAFGCDIWFDVNPFEVGMGYDWMVDLRTTEDFIGKKALTRIKSEGVERKIVGVEIEGASLGSYNDGSMPDYFPVYDGDTHIGKVTSACYSPRLKKNIGFAMVPIQYTDLGTNLRVDVDADQRAAQVIQKPFVDPSKDTPKG